MRKGFQPLKHFLFSTNSLKINAAANFAGNLWTGVLGLVFVPIYLGYIGIEAYGLIGIFSSIVAIIGLLDFGLSPTLNRELARLSGADRHAQAMLDVKTTLEKVNWVSAALIACLFAIMVPFIAGHWIQPQELTVETVTRALLIMTVSLAMQFTVNFYVGGLIGLQKQLLLNLILIVCGTLRFGGAFLVLAYYSPTITAFLSWQALVVSFQAVLMALTLKYSLPSGHRNGRFRKKILGRLWRFAAGMTGITIVSLILMQTDKVILSRMLPLKSFGYYTLAVTMATMIIGTIAGSFAHAVYPRLSQFVSSGDSIALRTFYHRMCQTLAVLVFPVTIIMALFSREILQLWLRNPDTVDHTYLLLTLIAIGTGLNSCMWLPYYLQLAHGWTKLTFYINLAAIILLIPFMLVGIYLYGAVGGALFWVIVNCFCIAITIHLMHRRILRNEKWNWYFSDLALPLSASILTAGTGRLLLPGHGSPLESFAGLLGISTLTLFVTALSAKSTRESLKHYWGKITDFGKYKSA